MCHEKRRRTQNTHTEREGKQSTTRRERFSAFVRESLMGNDEGPSPYPTNSISSFPYPIPRSSSPKKGTTHHPHVHLGEAMLRAGRCEFRRAGTQPLRGSKQPGQFLVQVPFSFSFLSPRFPLLLDPLLRWRVGFRCTPPPPTPGDTTPHQKGNKKGQKHTLKQR